MCHLYSKFYETCSCSSHFYYDKKTKYNQSFRIADAASVQISTEMATSASNVLSHIMQAVICCSLIPNCQWTTSSEFRTHFPEAIWEMLNIEERYNRKEPCIHCYLASWGCMPCERSTSKENALLVLLFSACMLNYNTPRRGPGFQFSQLSYRAACFQRQHKLHSTSCFQTQLNHVSPNPKVCPVLCGWQQHE